MPSVTTDLPASTNLSNGRPGQGRSFVLPLAWLLMLGAVASFPACRTPGDDRTSADQAPPAAQAAGGEESPPAVRMAERLRVRVLRSLPHDRRAFTQGLLWHDGSLWESTGQYGRSQIRRLDPETGEVLHRVAVPREYFGEGLARVAGELYQLTWREGTALVWSLPDLGLERQLTYPWEGWGLCFDGRRLVFSDGSDRLRFLAPDDLRLLGEVRVTLDGAPLRYLNELECVGDRVWANVWTREELVRIDPEDGAVDRLVDASGLLQPEERKGTDVLNGIARHPERGTYFLTGKLWPKMFEVELGELAEDEKRAAAR